MAPTTLGKYQLLDKLAAGGMAEIYVARAAGLPGFDKIVVVKRILPHLAADEDFVRMFLDEARIAMTLHHPNVVQMYDVGLAHGDYFIAMEYLHGEDLRRLMKALRLAGVALPGEQALPILTGGWAGPHQAPR